MIYTPLTKKAMEIAFRAHKEQLDKSGLPYIYHPIHLAEQMRSEEAICVALLHDVVEDTPITIDQLKAAGFPPQVTDALALLSHDPTTDYMAYVEKISQNPIASQVKLADLRHNSDLTRLEHPDERALARVKKYSAAIRLLQAPNLRDRIRGCLFGGAAGDALGYAVEFSDESSIFFHYGPMGIQSYAPSHESGLALISDDTQMTLFTANAAIFGHHRANERGVAADLSVYANLAYRDWLDTQQHSFREASSLKLHYPDGWISH